MSESQVSSLDTDRHLVVPWQTKMAWAEPQYSRQEVDEAGVTLIGVDWHNIDHAMDVINNWRSSHDFPLNTFQNNLRRKSKEIDKNSTVVQRLKRLPAMYQKLTRFDWLTLSEMQDIGGVRAVVNSNRNARRLVTAFEGSSFKHRLADKDDYVRRPKTSGYRGYHLIYRYRSDKKDTFNDLKVEIQIRSQLQHAWATAVETVGMFIRQALKSSQGDKEWLRFFSLMGSEIALREKTPLVPGTPTDKAELLETIENYARKLDVENRLQTYGAALRVTADPTLRRSRYFLVKLEPTEHRVTVTSYKLTELQQASTDYQVTEEEIRSQPQADVVLVSADSMAGLRTGYPNYFLDTSRFLAEVRRVSSG